jgi:hypothetical protein
MDVFIGFSIMVGFSVYFIFWISCCFFTLTFSNFFVGLAGSLIGFVGWKLVILNDVFSLSWYGGIVCFIISFPFITEQIYG